MPPGAMMNNIDHHHHRFGNHRYSLQFNSAPLQIHEFDDIRVYISSLVYVVRARRI